MNAEKAHKIFDYLKSIDDNFYIAGSARRGKKEDLHDLDVVYMGEKVPMIPGQVAFVKGKDITRYTIDGEQVDIYRTDPENFGAMLLFLTGPQEFNIIMRAKAKRKGMLLNQKGLYDRETREFIAGENEEEIFNAMEMTWKEPELRGIKNKISI
jgi:DNA polymerase/3'-5' exonuclease PolX